MKKLLAMVLALVMTLSLAVSANAFTDDSKVNDSYAEAVAVLNGMGVFKGYEDGSFKPEGNITRAEVVTIVYRVYTQNVKVRCRTRQCAKYSALPTKEKSFTGTSHSRERNSHRKT